MNTPSASWLVRHIGGRVEGPFKFSREKTEAEFREWLQEHTRNTGGCFGTMPFPEDVRGTCSACDRIYILRDGLLPPHTKPGIRSEQDDYCAGGDMRPRVLE